jgi:hypothetical protein
MQCQNKTKLSILQIECVFGVWNQYDNDTRNYIDACGYIGSFVFTQIITVYTFNH